MDSHIIVESNKTMDEIESTCETEDENNGNTDND